MADLIRVDGRVELPERLPVVALRDLVFFPYVVLPILVGRHRSLLALEEAREEHDGLVVLLAQKDPSVDDPTAQRPLPGRDRGPGRPDVHTPRSHLPRGPRGPRAGAHPPPELHVGRPACLRGAARRGDRPRGGEPGPAPRRRWSTPWLGCIADYAQIHDRIPDDLPDTLDEDRDRVRFAHLVAGHIIVPSLEKQEVLEAEELLRGLELLRELLAREIEILRIERKLDRQIQMRLGGDELVDLAGEFRTSGRQVRDEPDEWAELEERIRKTELPEPVRVRAEKELGRLRKLNPVAPEAAVIRTTWTGSRRAPLVGEVDRQPRRRATPRTSWKPNTSAWTR